MKPSYIYLKRQNFKDYEGMGMFLLSIKRGPVGWRPSLTADNSPTPHAVRNPLDVLESAYLTVTYMIHSSLNRQCSLEDDARCVS